MLAGDPRLIDELMQEMAGGGAWPATQGRLVCFHRWFALPSGMCVLPGQVSRSAQPLPQSP